MGLIYVNLEGFDGKFDLLVVVCDICDIFGCMVMNDEEIVVLIVGGYIFGKMYGVGDVGFVGFDFEGGLIEVQGFGWVSMYGSGIGGDVILSGFEVVWIQMLM